MAADRRMMGVVKIDMAEQRKVIISDDSMATRKIIRDTLKREEFEVREAENGIEALDMIFEERPDIAILNVQMPELDGWHVLKELKEDFRTSSIPVIMLAVEGEVDARTIGYKISGVDYLIKPFEPLELVARVKSFLEDSKKEQGKDALTGLTKNIALEDKVKSRLKDNERKSAFILLDMDNFKAFNNAYGYIQGDRAIKILADNVIDAIKDEGNSDDLAARIGGDDFMVVSTADKADNICRHIIEHFDKDILSLYSEEDRKKGYIVTEDSNGKIQRYSIMTLSIGITTTERKGLNDYRLVAEISREVKKCAKKLSGSNYFKDRRKKIR